jgi:transcriptional regulator with XRE-family HTH domain
LQKKQREIARSLKAEQKLTQEQIARLLGVSRELVKHWLRDKQTTGEGTTIGNFTNGCTPLDCRVKVPAKLHPVIVERVEADDARRGDPADVLDAIREPPTIRRRARCDPRSSGAPVPCAWRDSPMAVSLQ